MLNEMLLAFLKAILVYTVMILSIWADRSGQNSVDPDQTASLVIRVYHQKPKNLDTQNIC